MADVEILDREETLKNTDRGNMLAAVAGMPEMLSQAEKFSAGMDIPSFKKPAQILLAGMGGSAIAGDIAADLLFSRAGVPLITNRGYCLPEFAGPETLFFALSYSGNTEEVVASVKEAEKRGMNIICITTGGKLREIAARKQYPLVLVPGGFQPRAALPYLLVPLLTSLEKAGIAPPYKDDMEETIVLLKKLKDEYGAQRPARNNLAKQTAKKLVGKIPLILGATGTTAAAALRLKAQFNENSKTTAIANLFPEMNHNEMVSLSRLKKDEHPFSLIILRDENDHERVKKRIEITKSLVSRQCGGAIELFSQGKSHLARMLSLIFLGDHLSVYLALLQGIDPTPVDIISRLKKELER